MRPRPLPLLALLAACRGDLSAASQLDDPPPAKAPHVASASCPLRTPADWQAFVEAAAAHDDWGKTCSDQNDCRTRVGAFADRIRGEVLGTLARCSDDLEANPPVALCTDRLRRFLDAWLQQHDEGSYGFTQSNRAYLDAQESADKPAGMMLPPAALLAALPDRAAFEAAARAGGWPYLTHDSCLGSVRTFVLVVDPQDRFDQWFLVDVDPASPAVADPSILSFLAVQKADALGAPLPRPRLHFRDYQLHRDQGSWKLVRDERFNGKCYACHGSGARELLPGPGRVTLSSPVLGEPGYGSEPPPDVGLQRLASMNERLRSYGVPDWNGTLLPADHGPPLGEAQGCTVCHNGVVRGTLTVSTSEGMLWQKTVEQLSMRSPARGPVPDRAAMALLQSEATASPPLSGADQAALAQARAEHAADYQALLADRLPALRRWLLARRCD